MIHTTTKQLELSLWQDLESATKAPETADIKILFQGLERVVAEVPEDQRLILAGNAIAKIVEVYVKKANLVLDSLEVRDTCVGPILTEDFLSGLMRQSMTIDLSDLMENLFEKRQGSLNQETDEEHHIDSQDKKKAKVIADEAGHDAKNLMLELAGKEDVPTWATAISRWLTTRSSTESVSLSQLQQELGMPLVEIWLGMLLGGQDLYQWEQHGDFYDYPDTIKVFYCRADRAHLGNID